MLVLDLDARDRADGRRSRTGFRARAAGGVILAGIGAWLAVGGGGAAEKERAMIGEVVHEVTGAASPALTAGGKTATAVFALG